jgi:SAM-dependent methyltransferase
MVVATGMGLAERKEMSSAQGSVVSLVGVEQSPQAALAQWKANAKCPACDSDACVARAGLPDHNYTFGSERVAYPEQGIALVECGGCGLYYKSTLPAPQFLAEIFRREAQTKWASSHDFLPEAALLRKLCGGAPFDLLDVGAGDGRLLWACGQIGLTGRRSAFDVMHYPGIERHLTGEFIEGFLDDPLPAWSHERYDVVTLFDVLEHLYDPAQAFENLRWLLRDGGLVFIETGDSASFWPSRIGINHWWYARLLEHHVFWQRRSIARIAAAHGFRIVYWREVRHKSRRQLIPQRAVIDAVKAGLYLASRNHYASIAQLIGRQGMQPWYPFAVDHFQACLVRE